VVAAEDRAPDPEVERKVHQTIEKVTAQLADLQYNTAVAALMEALNVVRAGGRTAARAEVQPLVVMTAPFAPHVAEELWERLGHEGGIFQGAAWPSFDPEKARAPEIEVAVQVNGKLRGSIKGPPGMPREDAEARARRDENVARYLDGANVRRVVYVPDRLVNFVIG
jgi:leucyl-tRNA synthetase